MKSRLFIALPIDNEIGVSLQSVNELLNKYNSILKIGSIKNYHLTLKFLGETDKTTCDKMIMHFSQLEINTPPIPVILQGLGAFPSPSRATVLWCGLNTDNNSLLSIQKIVEDFSLKFNFKKEKRRFTPHITIARVRKHKKIPNELINYIKNNHETKFIKSTFKRIILFDSKLGNTGPIYTELSTIKLRETLINKKF